jgi:tetratricopeptide (TPR) repeat protein
MEQAEAWRKYKHFTKAFVLAQKNPGDALIEAERALEIHRRVHPEHISAMREVYVQILIANGDIGRAAEVTETLKEEVGEEDAWYWYAAGCVELAKDNPRAAVTDFEKAADRDGHFWIRYWLATAYLEAGRLGEAVNEFEMALSRYSVTRTHFPVLAAKAHYSLGVAYEKSGWSTKAIGQYEEFLDIWKDADLGIPEVEDAHKRLARLKSET